MVSEAVGEILESSTTEFVAGCHQLFGAPAFGSLLRARTREPEQWVYGLVYNVVTGSEPPGGSAVVLGSGQVQDERIYQEHPELQEMMRTRLSALIVGFGQGEALHQYLPPHPPPLHYSVYACDDAQVAAFCREMGYFRTVLAAKTLPADELLAASVRLASAAADDGAGYRLRAGREVARLLSEEYDRLAAIVRRITP